MTNRDWQKLTRNVAPVPRFLSVRVPAPYEGVRDALRVAFPPAPETTPDDFEQLLRQLN